MVRPGTYQTRLPHFPRACKLLALSLALAAAARCGWASEIPANSSPQVALPPDSRSPLRAPYTTVDGPVPTHRFWAAKNWFPAGVTDTGGEYTMFAEPLAIQTTAQGVRVGYSPKIVVQSGYFIHPVQFDFVLGVAGLRASSIPVSGFTDWTVDFDYGRFKARVGRGMPFLYIMTDGSDPVLRFSSRPTVFSNSDNVLGVTVGGNSYGLFCPSGGTWSYALKTIACHLPKGKHYFSAALLPDKSALGFYGKYAFSFPQATTAQWSVDENTGAVRTVYRVATQPMEGTQTGFLQALYPHQYGSLSNSTVNTAYTYVSARGTMKVIDGTSFTTVDIFHGILPFLPVSSRAVDRAKILHLLASDPGPDPFPATDTYATGKSLNRLAQLLPLAAMEGDTAKLRALRATMEKEFSRWFRTGSDDHAPGFLYERRWGTVIGNPASFGSASQLNDHHFQYGYWIEAAALLGMYDPAWLHSDVGGRAVQPLARDIATPVRDDPSFPFLRHFDVYAGHSWASGQAPFADGEDEESQSEAVNAWAALVLYASETNNASLRDAAIWMYTLETNAARDYWFNDGAVKTFPAGFLRTQVANVFDGKSDTATWFGNASAEEHAIEWLPFTGASLYLGADPAYCRRNLEEAAGNSIDSKSSEWPDLLEMYQAFYSPQQALESWKNTRFVFDGESRTHEFAWITSLLQLGSVDTTVTADTLFYAVFRLPSGKKTHVAFNLSDKPSMVAFSDGARISVPPHALATDTAVKRIGD